MTPTTFRPAYGDSYPEFRRYYRREFWRHLKWALYSPNTRFRLSVRPRVLAFSLRVRVPNRMGEFGRDALGTRWCWPWDWSRLYWNTLHPERTV